MSAFAEIVGQDRAVSLLLRAIERPVHAYLFVGARGSGVEEAVKAWAAERVAPGDARVADLARRQSHPDVIVFESSASEMSVAEARELIREVYASPIETDHKVVIVLGADRMSEVTANVLLKTLEEPPARSTIVLVAERPDRLLPTVRSRCQRIDFSYLSNDAVRQYLLALDNARTSNEQIEQAVNLAGGRLDRARALIGPLAPVRETFIDAVISLNGTGASAVIAADAIDEVVNCAVAALEETQKLEVAQLEQEGQSAGYPERVVSSQRKTLVERHKREHRRARTEIWLEGYTAIETWYRDALVGPSAPALVVDRKRSTVSLRAAAAAIEQCRRARQALTRHNASEILNLLRLLVRLGSLSAKG